MWEDNAIWLHPLLGLISLLTVLFTRRDLMNPTTKRHRLWRWTTPLYIITAIIIQVLFILRGVYEIEDLTGVAPTIFFGILGCVAALLLYLSYVRRWFGDGDAAMGSH